MENYVKEPVVKTDLLRGVTQVRFGIFLAMLAGTVEGSEEGKSVWKVWQDEDEKNPIKLQESLPKEMAVKVAQAYADRWRALGRPKGFADPEFGWMIHMSLLEEERGPLPPGGASGGFGMRKKGEPTNEP